MHAQKTKCVQCSMCMQNNVLYAGMYASGERGRPAYGRGCISPILRLKEAGERVCVCVCVCVCVGGGGGGEAEAFCYKSLITDA